MKLGKISLALIASILSASAFADVNTTPVDDSGIYGDLQFGWVTPHTNLQPYGNNIFGFVYFMTTAISFGSKLSIGYQFNQNYAVQVGAFDAQEISTSVETDPNFKSSLYYFDLALKGMYPLPHNFTLDGLVGLAYAQQSVSGATSIFDPPNGTQSAIVPEIGGGIAYNFTPKFNISLSVLYLAPSNNGISSTFYIPLGVSYRF